MSADLFAEFSTVPNTNQPQQNSSSGGDRKEATSSFSFFDDLTSTTGGAAAGVQPSLQYTSSNAQSGIRSGNETAVTDDADDWGDFEDSTSHQPQPPATQDPFLFPTPQVTQPTQPTWPTESFRNDLSSYSTFPQVQASQEGWTKAAVVKAKKSTDPSVLFDAEDEFGDDDDFGDFEGGDINPPPGSAPDSSAVADLLGNLTFTDPAPTPGRNIGSNRTNNTTSSPAKRSPTGGFGSMAHTKLASISAPESKHTSIPSSTKVEDAWDTFDDWEASIPAKVAEKTADKSKESKLATLSPIISPTQNDAQPGELPPTNIPPPAVLLSLFPPLFAQAQNQLFKPMAAQALPLRNKLLAEPGTIAYLQGYLMLAAVAAHIIAGRKLRWKRDQHLSQGMRIGPASSRATSGMKLSSVDKSENMKEEREVSDVVLAWKDQVGRLRHVVSAVNQIKSGTLGAVPEIQETMAVKTAKQTEGGVPAPQACMLCGLKRDERVGVADKGVEDSFGEWWIDQVNMHRGCRNFWNEHRDKLRQR